MTFCVTGKLTHRQLAGRFVTAPLELADLDQKATTFCPRVTGRLTIG